MAEPREGPHAIVDELGPVACCHLVIDYIRIGGGTEEEVRGLTEELFILFTDLSADTWMHVQHAAATRAVEMLGVK